MSSIKQQSFDQPNKSQNPSSMTEFLADIWKHKKILWDSFSNYKMIALAFPTIVFVIKSRWLRKVMMKRNFVKQKSLNLPNFSKLDYIQWERMFQEEDSDHPIILVEGIQGTGKTILSRMYLEQESKIRPTLYISLRDITAENWKAELARQTKFYAEPFIKIKR